MPTEREVLGKIIRAADDETLALLRKAEVVNPADPQPMVIVGGSDPFGIIGSMQRKCDQCVDLLWVSPSTLDVIEKRGNLETIVICVACLVKRLKENGSQ